MTVVLKQCINFCSTVGCEVTATSLLLAVWSAGLELISQGI